MSDTPRSTVSQHIHDETKTEADVGFVRDERFETVRRRSKVRQQPSYESQWCSSSEWSTTPRRSGSASVPPPYTPRSIPDYTSESEISTLSSTAYGDGYYASTPRSIDERPPRSCRSMNQSESYCSNTYRSYASTPRPVEHIYRADSPSVLRRPGKQVYYSPSQAWGQVPHAADHPHLDSTSGYQQQSARHPYQHRQCMTPQQPRQLHPYHPQYQYHHQAAVQDHAAGWVSQQSCMSITQKDLEEVFHCVRFNRMDVLERLLGRGVPVNIRDSYGNTPLMIACQVGSRRIAKTLLRRGADINATNYKGNTSLHFCCAYGWGQTLGSYLMSKGADPSVGTASGVVAY